MYCLFSGHVQYVRVMSCIVYSGVMFSMLESCHVLFIQRSCAYVRVMYCLFRGHFQYVGVMSCIVYSGVMFSMLESCHVLFIQRSCSVC